MSSPDEAQWARVEELAQQLNRLGPERVALRLSELAASGESPTVLTLLNTWLSLPPPPAALEAGTLLGGRYLLREKLGEGGMGSVWRARQEMIGRDVAVKIIHPSLVTPALQARFAVEMNVLGQIDHPGIVKIFDAGTHRPPEGVAIPFFAMELIEGQRLDRWAAPRRGQPVELLRAVSEICAALGSAHERQIVHRDLKPGNILVRTNGHPVILDFGIARLRGLVLGEEEGLFSGTPQYAAPEQHLGRDHDYRSGESVDIYAMGAILFEIQTGRKLIQFPAGASMAEMRRTVLEKPLPRLSEVMAGCPPVLEEIVTRAVRRDPADRFYSVAALGRAIDRVTALIASPEVAAPVWRPAARAIIPQTNWVLTEKIGEGGTGEVWVGNHKQLEERRVFKFCDTEEKARTLKREVTLYRLLKERVGAQRHFIALHEVSLDEPPYYIMMDHVPAHSLDAWCAAQPGGLAAMPEAERMEIIIQTAEALQTAHEAGILHRDIKPANLLLLDDKSKGLHVFVADFGIGQIVTEQLLRDNTRLGFTRTVSDLRHGSLSGTLLYLAPEVLEGGAATARSDIYSLGVVLWQLLAGNLHAALDPSDWTARIPDPILRDYLRRCLAGSPEKRWASAGELAVALRSLPERRAAEERRQREMEARERAAYRRGILRTACVATAILLLIGGLAAWALILRHEAERARGEIALDQAMALSSEIGMGRIEKGVQLLEAATKTGTNRFALRTAAASVLGLLDLAVRVQSVPGLAVTNDGNIPKQPGEVVRTLSKDGEWAATARDVDGRNGSIDIFERASGRMKLTISRNEFPWMPIAEPGMLSFNPDKTLLAVGGAATSRHVLLVDTTNGAVRAYLFHGSDPLSLAWSPGGRFIATGCADGTIRIWDVTLAAGKHAADGSEFSLPPRLDAPALDEPSQVLQGRGRVEHLVFVPDGKWLAAADGTGRLRIFSGVSGDWLSGSSGSSGSSAQRETTSKLTAPILAVEAQLEKMEQVSGLSAEIDTVIVNRRPAISERFQIAGGRLPEQIYVGPELVDAAWKGTGDELCVTTLTDAFWLHTSPLKVIFHSPGNNASGVVWSGKDDGWLLSGEDRIDAFELTGAATTPHLEKRTRLNLVEAVKGQGAMTSLAATVDGRVAAYRGRRIQFFTNNSAAPLAASIIADSGPEVFRQMIWEAGGGLLSVVLGQSNSWVKVKSWKTSPGFPPVCVSLPDASLDCERVAAANDGQSLILRSVREGIVTFNPATGARVSLDRTSAARQGGPLACAVNGAFLAFVVDRNTVRLLKMPGGIPFADLQGPRNGSAITAVRWDNSGSRLATLTEDGYVQVWILGAWQEWLGRHALN